ncbi:MAG: hypothetical protein GY842_11705 [bacterium]|nr:hypothetical protein [bacterium]
MSSRGPWYSRLDRWVLFIGLLAVVTRLAYLEAADQDPTFYHPTIDASEYDSYARALAEDGNPWPGAYSRPPLYPQLLSVVYRLCDSPIRIALTLQALLGGASCVLTCLLGMRLFSRRVGLAAGAIVAVYGPMVFFDERLLASSLVVFSYLVVLLLTTRALSKPVWYNWMLVGLATGVSALTRPSIAPFFLLVLLVSSLATMLRTRRWKPGLAAVLCLLVGSVAPIVPVTVRNLRACGEFIPITTLGGVNLFIGNNPDAEQTIAIRPGFGWERLMRRPHAQGTVSAAEKEAYFSGLVAKYARENPVDFVAGLLRKTRLYLSAREIPRNFDIYTHRQFSGVMSALTWRIGGFGFPFGVLLPLAILGIVVGCPACPRRWVLAGYVGACVVSVILFFNASRYRLPVVPVLALFAAHGVAWLSVQLAAGRYRRAGVSVAGLLALGVGVNLPVGAPTDAIDFKAQLYHNLGGRLMIEGRVAEAERAWRTALDHAPDSAEIHAGLSFLLSRQGRAVEALTYARQAVELDRDLVEARTVYASTLQGTGDIAGALDQLCRAVEIEPGYAVPHAALGTLLTAAGKQDEAIHHLRKAVHLERNKPSHHVALARALIQEGTCGTAIAALEDAPRWADSDELTNELAWLLSTCPDPVLRDPQRGLVLATRLVHGRTDPNPVYLDTQAAALAAAGRFEEAAGVAARAATAARVNGLYDDAAGIDQHRALFLSKQPLNNPQR